MVQNVEENVEVNVAFSGRSRICQRGDHGEHAEREPILGSGGGAPAESNGRAPGGRSGGKAA